MRHLQSSGVLKIDITPKLKVNIFRKKKSREEFFNFYKNYHKVKMEEIGRYKDLKESKALLDFLAGKVEFETKESLTMVFEGLQMWIKNYDNQNMLSSLGIDVLLVDAYSDYLSNFEG